VLAGLSAAFSLTACGSFTSSGDALNEAEVGALAGALVGQGFPGTGGASMTPAAPSSSASAASAAAPTGKISVKIDDSGPCQGGGTVSVTGDLSVDVNQTAQTGTLEYNFTLVPNGCKVTSESGKVFTLTGDPNVKGDGKLNWAQNSFQGALNYSGKFNWESSDGRSGACGVDLNADFHVVTGSITANLTGSVCGITVNRNVSVTA
jgi:hypothetical protein